MTSRRSLAPALATAVFLGAWPQASAQTYSDWLSAQFSTPELADPAISGPAADPDGDGVPNLNEFVFVGAPKLAETPIGPVVDLVSGTLALSYRERLGLSTSGVSVNLEVSDNLTHWITPNQIVEADREPFTVEGYDRVTLLDPLPLASSPTPGRRFLRLRADLFASSSVLKAPTSPTVAALSPTTYEVRWSDWNDDETGHQIERFSSDSGLWEAVGTTAADTSLWLHTAADYSLGFTYRVSALRSSDSSVATSASARLLDSDNDGIPDAFELGSSYFGTAGTYATYPDVADSDGDRMPDGWEILYGLNPLDPLDASGDLNGNGVSNLNEYLEGTDPTLNFYQGVAPVMTVVDGADQARRPGEFLPRPMRVRVTTTSGSPLIGAPVRFTARPDEGLLSVDNSGTSPLSSVITVNADVEGYAQVWLKCP